MILQWILYIDWKHEVSFEQTEEKQTGANKQVEDPFLETRKFFLQEGLEDYNLIVTGHSLGAGIATILTLLLHKRLPRVRGIVYFHHPASALRSQSYPELDHCHICRR